jgi:alpha-1,4-galacturonosyltransferase
MFLLHILTLPVMQERFFSFELLNFIRNFTSYSKSFYRVETKSEKMEVAIAKAKSVPVVCDNVDKKLRQIYDLTEDEADFHMKQSAFLYKLNVLTMPKSFHCLALKLTVEYFKSSHDEEHADSEKFKDSSLHHYIIFSNNVLPASVVINSTVTHAKVCFSSNHAPVN